MPNMDPEELPFLSPLPRVGPSIQASCCVFPYNHSINQPCPLESDVCLRYSPHSPVPSPITSPEEALQPVSDVIMGSPVISPSLPGDFGRGLDLVGTFEDKTTDASRFSALELLNMGVDIGTHYREAVLKNDFKLETPAPALIRTNMGPPPRPVEREADQWLYDVKGEAGNVAYFGVISTLRFWKNNQWVSPIRSCGLGG